MPQPHSAHIILFFVDATDYTAKSVLFYRLSRNLFSIYVILAAAERTPDSN